MIQKKFKIMCGIFIVFGIMCVAVVFSLLLHHYYKHEDDLDGAERCFQVEDIFVLCDRSRPVAKRCSHEQFIVVFVIAATILIWKYAECTSNYEEKVIMYK